MSAELKAVLQAANEVLDERDPQLALDKLAAYVESFGQWSEGELQERGASRTTVEREELGVLLQKHTAVMQRGEELRAQLAGEMKQLKVRGKGIMAYLDILPKQLNMFTRKKL